MMDKYKAEHLPPMWSVKASTSFDSQRLAFIPAVLPWSTISPDISWFSDYRFLPAALIYLPGNWASCHCISPGWGGIWHRMQWDPAMRSTGPEPQERLCLLDDEHQRKPQLNVHMFPNFANFPDLEKHPDAKVNFRISNQMFTRLSICI